MYVLNCSGLVSAVNVSLSHKSQGSRICYNRYNTELTVQTEKIVFVQQGKFGVWGLITIHRNLLNTS